MDLITQRNQQASPEDPANHVCEILSEIKDIKYSVLFSLLRAPSRTETTRSCLHGSKNIDVFAPFPHCSASI
jgi:hypothetical protein